MPYGMPAMVMKGPVLESLDKLLNDRFWRPRKWLETIHDELMDPSTRIADLMVKYGVLRDGSYAHRHVRLHWFPDDLNGEHTWWRWIQPIETRTKIAYAHAIELNLDGRWIVPFDSYWVCVPGWDEDEHEDDRSKADEEDDDAAEYYQIFHCRSVRQLTVLIATPPEPGGYVVSREERQPEPIFLTRRQFSEPIPEGLEELRCKEVTSEIVCLYQINRLWNKVLTEGPPG